MPSHSIRHTGSGATALPAAETRRIAGKPRVVVTRRLLPETEARMGELFDAVFNTDDRAMSRDELIAAMADADVLVPTLTDTIDADLIASAPPRLRLIANFGAGIEHIDLGAARARKIMVTNTPGVFTDDTADMTLGLILSVTRRLTHGARVLRNGQWQGWAPSTLLGHRVGGRALGIVGMGRIGQAVAHRARAFGLKVIYHNRHRVPEALETMLGARYEPDLDALVAAADILTLHCPATPETRHLIDARRIALMKPGALIINTSRGTIVEEEAMIEALVSGHLGGAGLDVFEHEPLVDQRLRDHDNVAIVPHMGSATVEGRIASGEKVIANIRFWADGHRPPDQVLEGWL
ncbi:glycolate reductase [Novosphingobium nitrogenifigens DSM 19370]|uniref:Glycolate reductase n=1 Tax=Novosphingobium nitrogenifigens DSM 19370 TaxID=983920 RepID=F1Z948_9SPHN|nr:D-glycerate dehydrogenase [Novosphingobium nitrogenifigens]EGD58932.1 glycolate reductase [Novosphingobium nitrogenifigens DSM 19370]